MGWMTDSDARQKCIDACLKGMKLKYALQKFQVDGISDSRSPGYRKLDRLIRKLKSKQRLRAGARIEFVLVFVIVV